MQFARLGQQLQSVHARQTEVSHQHLLYLGVYGGQRVFGTFKGHMVYPAQTQRDADGFAQVGVIFNQKNLKRIHELDDVGDVNESLNEYYEPDFVEENDKEPENVTVLVPEQINRIDNEEEVKEVAATEETDNVDLINNNEQMDGENRSDESLKKIIEEITNTVPYITTTADPQIFQSEINVSDKFKILNSKIPNYFLPQKDMEKSMKELQNNYLEVIFLY